ncbi:MAG: Bacteriorhodopsin-like protein [uncultured Frankineae bacterium]|uniref:Bacteriorhodopsin-like protein n=1 Tax=uncultured Frankineae bacterium TaxID=437475 RepID=A0A6J4M9A3_9ACTN|nr:MAG: Bacteriorhodopsin-like protein [uncultured Frankineae bacterium]
MLIAAGIQVTEISSSQYQTVYNLLSLAIASLFFTGLYLVLSQRRVLPRYRNAVVVSAIVCFIATYHYVRIFDNFGESYETEAQGGQGTYVLTNVPFNEGYRYVDWFLTVPLLLVETIAVLALARAVQKSLLTKLVIASGLMIALGYPGEITTDLGPRLLWGTLSTIPFLYILYVLFVELSASLERQPAQVRGTVSKLRIMLVGLWGVYPIAYLFPVFGFDGADAFVLRQAGYSIADILAKAAFGLVIYKIARVKSEVEDPAYDEVDAVSGLTAEPGRETVRA